MLFTNYSVPTFRKECISGMGSLMQSVYVRENLTCNDPIEVPYYSSEKFEDLCIHCACATTDTTEGSYHICQFCKQSGKLPVLKGKGNYSNHQLLTKLVL